MGLAVMHSDCIDAFNPGPVLPQGMPPEKNSLTECVCGNTTLIDAYLNCYGFCTIDPADDPFCPPVAVHDEEDTIKKRFSPKTEPVHDCDGPACDAWYAQHGGGWIGECFSRPLLVTYHLMRSRLLWCSRPGL